MELIKRKVGDVLVVGFAETGPLEASNVGPFRERMANLIENTTKLLIDIGNVTFLDSSGLGAILFGIVNGQCECGVKAIRVHR